MSPALLLFISCILIFHFKMAWWLYIIAVFLASLDVGFSDAMIKSALSEKIEEYKLFLLSFLNLN